MFTYFGWQVQLIVDQSHSYPALNQGKDRATTIRIDSVPSILPASRLFRNASTVDDAEEAESLVAPYNQQIIQPGGAVESAENDHLDESRTESPPVASNSRPGQLGNSISAVATFSRQITKSHSLADAFFRGPLSYFDFH